MNEEDCRIVTYTSKQINPLRLKPEDVDIRDIAHSLACSNRFIGHTAEPISIAQHSVYVMALAEYHMRKLQETNYVLIGLPERIALQGLLHDGPEYVLGDVTKLLKQTDCMKGFREAEDRAWGVISSVLEVPYKLHWTVEWADQFMVRYEALQSWDTYPLTVQGYECPTSEELRFFHEATDRIGLWTPWDWRKSEQVFLTEFSRLRVLSPVAGASAPEPPSALPERLGGQGKG